MDYRKTLDFLFSQLPMYQRVGAAAYKSDLNNTLEICRVLGNPGARFRSLHVAGTNGKGSVSHMMASILQEAGFKTGLYTSPHLTDFRERIRINGEKIPEENVTSFVEKYTTKLRHVQPSFFEYTFGMAMEHFADERVDVAVVETGMGGRLDSTNVLTPMLSIITNIGMDHTRFLGDTLGKIAVEKAGIIKKGIPVVIGETQKETVEIFRKTAREREAKLVMADQVFAASGVRMLQGDTGGMAMDLLKDGKIFLNLLQIPFSAAYQVKNTITTIAAIEQLKPMGFSIPEQAVRAGFQGVIANTGLAGRWQVLGRAPLTICDTGHNREGIMQVVDQLKQLKYQKLHMVMGTVDDKEIEEILGLLPASAAYYFCKADIPRGLDQELLRQKALKIGLKGAAFPSVKEAVAVALKQAGTEDLVFIGGSTFVVAEVLQQG